MKADSVLPSCSSWCKLWISGNRNGANLGLLLGDSEGDEATFGCLTAGRYRTGCTAWTAGRMFDCCDVYCLEVPNGDHTLLRRSERIMAGLLGEYDRARRCTAGRRNLTRLRRWCKGRYGRWIAVPLRWSQAQ